MEIWSSISIFLPFHYDILSISFFFLALCCFNVIEWMRLPNYLLCSMLDEQVEMDINLNCVITLNSSIKFHSDLIYRYVLNFCRLWKLFNSWGTDTSELNLILICGFMYGKNQRSQMLLIHDKCKNFDLKSMNQIVIFWGWINGHLKIKFHLQLPY